MAQKHTHDLFFKIAFSRTDVVADFIGAFLPTDFSRQADLTTLTRISDSYVDEQLSQHYVDLLYSVQYGGIPVTVALLFEHKSYVEDRPHFQLMRYMLNYWQSQVSDKKPLTTIVPILLYHGRGNWKKQSVSSYFPKADSFLKTFIPEFDYVLINLRKTPDSQLELLKNNYAKVTAGLLRTIRERQELTRIFQTLATTFEQLVDDQEGRQFVRTAFLYVHWSSKLTSTEIVAIFEQISPKSAAVVMSAAELLLQEGLENGLKKGFQIGVEQGIEQGIKEGIEHGIKQGIEHGIKQGIEKGIKQGIEKGIEQGIEKGIKQGIEKGIERGDHEATVKHVKGLLEMGMNKQLICKAFGLTPKQLEAIIQEINNQ